MPNWCYESAEVKGPKEDVIAFLKAISKGKDDKGFVVYELNSLYPCPKELVETVEGWNSKEDEQREIDEKRASNEVKYGYKSWYDWCMDNYGTKWGACDVDADEEAAYEKDGTMILPVRWNSAWGTSNGLVAKISGMFPTLTFCVTATEEANFFIAWYVARAGEVVGGNSVDPHEEGMPDYPENPDDADALDEFYEKYNDQENALVDRMTDEMDKFLAELEEGEKILGTVPEGK
jgi:hypothetical protein